MTTQYMDEGGFKKKFLAPLVVIMVCAVALAGAVYAYSASVSNNGIIPDPDYYTIDFYNADGTTVVTRSITTDDSKTFDTYTKKNTNETYKAYVDDGNGSAVVLPFTTYVKVVSNKEGEACSLSSDVKYAQQEGTAAMYGGWANMDSDKHIQFNTTFCKYEESSSTWVPVDSFVTGTLYKVMITATLPVLEGVDLGVSENPAEKMKFNGINCITITLTASNTDSA